MKLQKYWIRLRAWLAGRTAPDKPGRRAMANDRACYTAAHRIARNERRAELAGLQRDLDNIGRRQ